MPPVTATNVRAGRATALLAAFQAAKGTVVTDFSAGTATELWTPRPRIPVLAAKSFEPGFTFEGDAPKSTESVTFGKKLAWQVQAYATEKSLEWLLKSNWGAYSSGAFTLASQVAADRWLTFAWVENTANTNGRLVRAYDAWVHTLKLRCIPPHGILLMEADCAAESLATPSALPVGGVMLPTFSPASIKNVFANATAVWTRDPSGLNVSLRLYELEVTVKQGFTQLWDGFRQKYSVYKTGRTEIEVRFRSAVSDETWAVIEDSLAGTKRQFRFTATAPSPAKTLTLNLFGVDFTVEELGRDGMNHVRFEAVGRAHKVSTDIATIGLA